MELQENCICGRTGDLRDRAPILDDESRWIPRCSGCGHLDYLQCLFPEESGLLL
jgi:hypothetical protein